MTLAGKRIVIIDGHPDPAKNRYVHALVDAYRSAALAAGHEVRSISLSAMNMPLLQGNDDFLKSPPPAVIATAQQDIAWSNHLAIFYPLWLGSMPALLKGFFEQVMRPGFAFRAEQDAKLPGKMLVGKSARIVVTMGMPALFYRWYFRAHSLKSLERNILSFVGIKPIRASVIGSVEGMSAAQRAAWLEKMRRFARLAK